MRKILLIIAACGFVAAIAFGAIAAGLGPLTWSPGWGDYRGGRLATGGGPVITRELEWTGGDTLEIHIPADVAYTQGPIARITVTGARGTADEVVVDGDSLRFDARVRDPRRLRVTMTAPDVETFGLRGSQRLTIDAYDHYRLEVAILGSGDVVARGRARAASLSIAGSGDADLGGLDSEETEVNIAGSGDATIAPRDKAELHIAGSGDITLLTRPADVETRIAGSGRVTHRSPDPAPAGPAK
jgi:hypothetical protein